MADWISVCTPPPHETEQPLDNTIIERTSSELMSGISDMPGVADALCVQVADDGIVVVVICDATDSPTAPLKFLRSEPQAILRLVGQSNSPIRE